MYARLLPRLLMVAVLLAPMPLLAAQVRFQEGRHYTVVPTPQTSGTVPAGRIEVAEVFSYVCNGCNQARGLVEQIKAGLPADAALAYVHAGFNQGWELFQRAHLTAQQLGIAERDHQRMFTAIWETAEFPYFDRTTGQRRQPAPTMQDAARFYAKGGGVTEADFLKEAASARIDEAVKRGEALIKGWQVPATPTFVVAGRYLIKNDSVGTIAELRDLFSFLVGLERSRLQQAAPAKKD
ncbi:MAG TPA: thiol:disulfide interchange protein DsbA/DsbL [Steroidobacteraceae bacterium]|nr:thiol:disulfide interchange protein DsbA/DsbL [Steroidobacteraceae bacterium]